MPFNLKTCFKILILIILFSALSFMVYKVIYKINYKAEVAEDIKTMPPFSFKTMGGTVFSNQDLKPNTSTIFINFNSTCEYCQHEAEQIKADIDQLKTVQLMFISEETPKQINDFAINYNLLEHDNITFLQDTDARFASIFDANSLPTLIIYGKNNQLIEKIKGQVKIPLILKLLKKTNNQN